MEGKNLHRYKDWSSCFWQDWGQRPIFSFVAHHLTIALLFFCFSCCCFDLNHHDNISTFWLDTLRGTHRCYATRFRTSQIRALSATTSIMLNPGLTTQLGILNNPRNHHHQQSTHPLFLLPDCPHPFPQPNDCSALHVRMMQAQA